MHPLADANAAGHFEVIEALVLAGAEETGAVPVMVACATPPRAVSRRKKNKKGGKKGKKGSKGDKSARASGGEPLAQQHLLVKAETALLVC